MKYIICSLFFFQLTCNDFSLEKKEKQMIEDFFTDVSIGDFKKANGKVVISDQISLNDDNLTLLKNSLEQECKNKVIANLRKTTPEFKRIGNTDLKCMVYQLEIPKSCYDTSMHTNIICIFGFERNLEKNKIMYYDFENGSNLFQIPK